MLGLLIAFAGILLGHLLHNPYYDRIASMLIGVVLVVISFVLVRESKSLLMGETISRKLVRRVVRLAQEDEAVVKVSKYLSTYLAPEEILLQLDTVFKNNLTTPQITDAIERIARNICKGFPHVKQIFIEPVKARCFKILLFLLNQVGMKTAGKQRPLADVFIFLRLLF